MTLSRETKIGLAVAGSFLCLVGAILAAQFCKSPPEQTKETAPAFHSTTSTAKVNSTPEVPPPPPSWTDPPLPNHRGLKSNEGVFGSIDLGEKTTSPLRVEDVVNGSENLRQLQSEYRRFWNTDQPPRVTAIHLPPSLSGPINVPNATAPTPKLATPLRSTQNPWDVSLAPPLFEDSPEARWIGLFR